MGNCLEFEASLEYRVRSYTHRHLKKNTELNQLTGTVNTSGMDI